MFKGLRNAFFAGLILLAPLGVTVVVVRLLLEKVAAPSSDFFFGFLDAQLRSKLWVDIGIQFLSLIIVLALITFLGYTSNYLVGKFFINLAEKMIGRLPFVNTVYNTVKQIVDTFSKQNKAVFQKTVLVEYPRKGVFALGFLTGDSKGEVQNVTGKTVVNIFIPTTPNPTSGFLLMIPEDEVITLEMSVSDGMKLIISGGAVVPPFPYPKKINAALEIKNSTEKNDQ